MRNPSIALMLTLVAAAPAAAQDTTVMIQNKDCTVKVDGKRLSAADEKKACERMRAATARLQELNVRMQRDTDVMAGNLARLQAGTALQERAIAGQMRAVEEATRGTAELRLRRNLDEERAVTGRLTELRDLTGRAMVAIAAPPRLGITVETRPRDTDKWGAYVSAVTPGGPADKGGIRSGDVIAKLGGKAVTGSGDETPGIRLIPMISALTPNKSVDVQIRRGNDSKTLKVTPSNDDSFFAGPAMVIDSVRRSFGTVIDAPTLSGLRTRSTNGFQEFRGAEFGSEPFRGSYTFTINTAAMAGPLASVEMTSLNAGLGAYFGATEGVLVINVGEKQELGLQAGDVVTSVDGRKVTSPGQLARILRTYEKGEEYKLQIMRQKKTETVTGKMP
jgi:C-terminal processing protease CtpA/Prc